MGASLFGTAAGLASDRGLGWLQVKRASPMPPFAYFAAKVITSMIFSTIIVLVLFLLGFTLGGVRMAVSRNREAARNANARFASFFSDGPGRRIFHRTELGAGHDQSDLSPNVVLQRTVGAVHVPAESREADRVGTAAVSPVATGVGNRRSREPTSRHAAHWEVLAAFTMICLGVARIGFQRDQEKMYG